MRSVGICQDSRGQDAGVVRTEGPERETSEGHIDQGLVAFPLPDLDVGATGPHRLPDHPDRTGFGPLLLPVHAVGPAQRSSGEVVPAGVVLEA